MRELECGLSYQENNEKLNPIFDPKSKKQVTEPLADLLGEQERCRHTFDSKLEHFCTYPQQSREQDISIGHEIPCDPVATDRNASLGFEPQSFVEHQSRSSQRVMVSYDAGENEESSFKPVVVSPEKRETSYGLFDSDINPKATVEAIDDVTRSCTPWISSQFDIVEDSYATDTLVESLDSVLPVGYRLFKGCWGAHRERQTIYDSFSDSLRANVEGLDEAIEVIRPDLFDRFIPGRAVRKVNQAIPVVSSALLDLPYKLLKAGVTAELVTSKAFEVTSQLGTISNRKQARDFFDGLGDLRNKVNDLQTNPSRYDFPKDHSKANRKILKGLALTTFALTANMFAMPIPVPTIISTLLMNAGVNSAVEGIGRRLL